MNDDPQNADPNNADASQADFRELQEAVLRYVNSDKYQPVKPRVIAKKLKLPKDRHIDLKRAVKRLVQAGKLTYGSGHLIKPAAAGATPAAGVKGVTGVFRRTSQGYGFVRPTLETRVRDRSQDIFIPLRKSLDAASGDTVSVVVKRRVRDGETRLSGEIVEVLERETHQFVGLYRERVGIAEVFIDGGVFAQAIPVGDPGAKNAAEGDKVVIEMVRFPSHLHEGEGVIVEVLGPRGAPGVDTLSIIMEYNLPGKFPEEVLDNAREKAEQFDESIGEDRLDLTGETIITIDPVDARDFDDAISLVRLDNGHWKLGVHIADVAHFVQAGSPLDGEARNRATSTYLPDRVIPMLPEIVSNNLASLQPDRVRYTRSCYIEFTPEGERTHVEVHRAAIKSCRRFTYEEVDDYLERPANWTRKLTADVRRLLDDMHTLAMVLRKRRLQRGAIELSLPEVKIDLDKQGRVTGAHVVENTVSHQIIEEFMLSANEAVAQTLTDAGFEFLRRVHQQPDLRKLRTLTEFIRELGFECDSLESRFEIKRVIEMVAGRPEERAVNFAVLRSMQKAVYSPEEEGHYALHSNNYCHFTSPIRRYPDLTIHRALDALARGKRPDGDLAGLVALGDHCSDREQRAESAERELIKVKLLDYLSHRIGQKMHAVITGVESFGLFAQGVELPAEGLIHAAALDDDYYHYDKETHSLTGRRRGNRYRLGDYLEVTVAHVDIDRRELDFRIVRRLKSAKPAGAKQGKKKPTGKQGKKAKAPKKSKRRSGSKPSKPGKKRQ